MGKAKTIMVQGTMSNVGKSVIAAALCRIFARRGCKVAPFKSQNMALNSFITKEGLEMGRAQVMQAEAAGIEPDVRMNPILLKPTSDTGSQVIVRGKPIGNMRASEYFAYKKTLLPVIQESFEELSEDRDIIVIEGAGSPAEINLNTDDIVNMGIAKLLGAPVLLVGDIDRGGVFAQIYGTLALLKPEEKAHVKAFLFNKFRGDITLLSNGVRQLEELTGVACAGVVPYLALDIADEDSLSAKLLQKGKADAGSLDIAIIRFPKISNFTDFDTFGRLPQVCIRYVEAAAELGNPDVLILPGTKSTISDMNWLRKTGLAQCVSAYARQGFPLIGICGGLQMLGQTITDFGAETVGHTTGLGLLPIDTIFTEEKIMRQVSGMIEGLTGIYASWNNTQYEGYELHMGRSECVTGPFVQQENVLGTYIHGIFDNGLDRKLAALFLDQRQGFVPIGESTETMQYNNGEAIPTYKAYQQQQYDLLADAVEQALDMRLIERMVEEGQR